MRKLTTLGIAAVFAATAILPLAASSASAAKPAGPRPTVVLVHGAFADASSWTGVISRLRRRLPRGGGGEPAAQPGRRHRLPPEVLAGVHGPIVLAGHSYDGMLISGAATGNPQVKALAYIAAFAPDAGESALGLSNEFPGSTLGDTLSATPLGDGTNDLTTRQDEFPAQFAADVSREDAALAAVTQRPVRDAALTAGAPAGAWHTIPSWFLIPAADKNIRWRRTASWPGAPTRGTPWRSAARRTPSRCPTRGRPRT